MNNSFIDEPMLEMYIFESSQILEILEQIMIQSEVEQAFSEDSINEIFRHMHTIKGSSAMMMYNNISGLAHVIEDFFYLIREDNSLKYDFSSLVDIILESVDFFKIELIKVKNSEEVNGDNTDLVNSLNELVDSVKKGNKSKEPKKEKKQEDNQKYYIRPNVKSVKANHYQAIIHFEDGCEMENIRAYTIVQNALEIAESAYYYPNDIIDNEDAVLVIRKDGFKIVIKTQNNIDEVRAFFENTIFLRRLELDKIGSEDFDLLAIDFQEEEITEDIKIPKTSKKYVEPKKETKDTSLSTSQSMISVHVEKLDKLMDMVGELVIAESMVTQNPEVKVHEIESFDKASRQLRKISGDLQDMVMAIRMVPLSTTFLKMHRIVRDMTRKLGKDVVLDVFGEETEVDKNIIEKISDPLMHIIRNSIDHGIEDEKERIEKGKSKQGTIILEAKNSGSDVLIIVKDDGKGLDKNKIYEKAFNQGLIDKPIEEMKDREIFNLILNPGFSTNEIVTEFSGRGVGMDVVSKNIEGVGGSVIVDSEIDKGTSIILKIPLTLAIIEGMNIKVGDSRFTLPIMTIKESFRPEVDAVFQDTDGNEMIMLRGECFPVLRLHKLYQIETDVDKFEEGILIMIEENERSSCVFADELLGQQQVVVKTLPNYIKRYKNIRGLAGCTLLGDGSISLILDVGDLNISFGVGS